VRHNRDNDSFCPCFRSEKFRSSQVKIPSAPPFLKAGNRQIGKSVAGGGIMGFRLVDRAKIIVYQIDGADREYDTQRDGQDRCNDEIQNHFAGHRG
jgi:hypothetical protein